MHAIRRRPTGPRKPSDALVPPTIECVDCGGNCHVLSHAPEEGWEPGDVVAYRCEDCLDRWDVVIPDADDHAEG